MVLGETIFLFSYGLLASLFLLIFLLEILLDILDVPKNYNNIRIFYFLNKIINKFKRD